MDKILLNQSIESHQHFMEIEMNEDTTAQNRQTNAQESLLTKNFILRKYLI